MNKNTIRAIKKANEFLRLVEDFTEYYCKACDEAATAEIQEESPFFQLGRITNEKYGAGCYLSLILLQQGINTLMYFQGKIDLEHFELCKLHMQTTLNEIDSLSNPQVSKMLH